MKFIFICVWVSDIFSNAVISIKHFNTLLHFFLSFITPCASLSCNAAWKPKRLIETHHGSVIVMQKDIGNVLSPGCINPTTTTTTTLHPTYQPWIKHCRMFRGTGVFFILTPRVWSKTLQHTQSPQKQTKNISKPNMEGVEEEEPRSCR